MKNQLLTKHCVLLLLALLAAWSTQAWADVTVNVKCDVAPHIYAWDNSQNKLTENGFPGDVMSETKVVKGITYYTMTFEGASSINLLFTNNDLQTGDFNGLSGEVFFNYDGAHCAYGKIPDNIAYEAGNVVYFVNTKNWTNVNCHLHNGGTTSTNAMTYVALDGAGQKIYKWGPQSLSFTPSDVIFNNGSWASQGGVETPSIDYAQGGYYVYSEYNNGSNKELYQVATIDASRITNSATYFADPHFREGITKSLGIAEGAAFTPADYTILDISYDANKGMTGKITNPTGIEHFTALEELYARDNSLTHLDLTHTTTLRVLDVSGNDVLQGMRGVSYCNANGNGVNVKGNNNFKKLVADNCPAWVFNAGLGSGNENYQYITSLEYISQKNNPLDGWSSGFTAQTNLKYLDLTNTGQNATHNTTSSRISVTALTQLETLILADNPNLGSVPGIKTCTKLQYIDLSNCGLTSSALGATNFETTGGSNLKYLDVSNNPALYNLSFTGKTNLEVLKMNNCTAYDWGTLDYSPNLKHIEFSGCTGMIASMWDHLNGTNHSKLQYLNLSNGTTAVSGHPINFPALDTLIVTNHNTITELNVTGHCPNYINVTNSTPSSSQLRVMAITNCGLSAMPSELVGLTSNPKLYRFDLTDNQFTSVPSIACPSLTTMVMNNNLLTNIDAPSNVRYLYAQNNNFPTGAYTLRATSLVGLDLGNNDFTKFKTENNTSLKSLALADNDNLTEIELHYNPLLTQTSPDGEIETDNGLYIKGLSNLKVLNIEYSSFNKLGQQHSLQGVTALETLKARHNEFTTFTNGVYELHTSATNSVNYRKPDPTQSSLEYQTNLKYLDLAYNKLRDSVHLYRNTALVHLDVSYNRSIDGQLDPAAEPLPKSEDQKAAILEQKGRRWLKYGKVKFNGVKKTYGVNVTESQWTEHYTNLQAGRLRPFDLRKSEAVCDLNDTTGLYHLDLGKNVNLEWLDISYTNIHNTAAGPSYMCPGWMTEDWVGDDDLSATNASGKNTTGRWYSSWHTFVYFIPCSKLKVIHADHNNMRSLGIRYFPDLDTLTCSYMYGDSELMRDFPTKWASGDLRYNMGNTALSTTIKKFHKVDWENLDDDGNPAIVLWGPNKTEAASDVYPNKLRYWDLSYSGFNEIRLYPGTVTPDLPYLEYVNVSGNPLNFQVRHYNSAGALVDNSTVSNYNSLDLTYCPNIRTVLAENCADLPVVRAHNRTKLDTLYLSNDPNLKTLYVQNDPLLKTNFQGLSTLTGLETLFGYNNTHWGNDITFASNTALKNLWISNIGASQLDVSANIALEKLRAYDNSLTALNLSGNANLLWLDVARNKLPEIDLSSNTKLQFFNISNGSDTRTQLDGTETLNHDGSDGDAIKPTTIFSADEAPIANADAGNSLSDLALPASITDARANGNDLHSITGNFANLTNMEFAHNHINGIDLSAAPGATIESRDNGRTILADCAKFTPHNDFGHVVTVYFFQLADLSQQEVQNGTQLTLKTSDDIKGDTRILGTDGLVLGNISWNQSNAGMLRNETTLNPGNMGDYLDPDEVPGSIVVLEAASETDNGAEGTATYTYDNGTSTPSVFYLNWSSDGTITGIGSVIGDNGFDLAGTYGGIVVAGKDGTVVGVYDLNGRQVASETITGGKALITGLTPGIYLVNGQKVLVK